MTNLPEPGRPDVEIASLKAELRTDSAWVAVPRPRLSWTVSATAGWRQAWAEVRVGDEIARVGDESVLVDWPFDDFAAGESRAVSVRASSTDGRVTAWSEPLEITAAFTEDWHAQPIGLADPDDVARPALLRTEFTVERPIARAVLHYTALGFTELSINGALADDAVLAPGWTSYRLRTVHESVDVTHLIHEGENAIGARLAGGWYTEQYHVLTRPARFFGDQPSLAAQLEIAYADGGSLVVATGDGWTAIGDPEILASGVYTGEMADARGAQDTWDRVGGGAGWPAALISDVAIPRPEPRMAPPARRAESVPVQDVLSAPDGGVILDFGKNLVGRLRVRVSGERGTRLVLQHAEVLDAGDLALRPLRLATQRDEFVLSGDGEETFEPRFTFHGFRYARIDGWPGELDPASVEAVVIETAMQRTGWFSSSDPLLNTFHDNVVSTMRSNYIAVPMDCPQRDERLGWTGDTQLFAPTAAFLYDCESFLVSWLRDLVLEQERVGGGLVPLFAPSVVPQVSEQGLMAAWGDAIAIVPDVLARASGDLSLYAEFYPAMRAWTRAVIDARDPDGLWTSGRQLGDWLDPNAPADAPARGRTDTEIVASAYAVSTTLLVARIAEQLGHLDDAIVFRAAAEDTRQAFIASYVTPGGRMMCDTQTAYAVALGLDVVTEQPLRGKLADRLASVVRRDGYHIATGLIGTSLITRALSENGHLDAAERLLMQTESPSWLYPVTLGATTVWERWDGLRPDGTLNPGAMVSFNHVALGSVAAWLHEEVAGLAPAAPGYRRIRIVPQPLRGLTSARAEHLTPYGIAGAGWERTPEGIRVRATVPPNASAEVVLPDGRIAEIGSGEHEWLVAEAPAPRVAELTLDSSLARLADDPRAYRAFHAALEASPNRFVASATRKNALYRETLRIRDVLVFADPQTLASVSTALAAATEAHPATDPTRSED